MSAEIDDAILRDIKAIPGLADAVLQVVDRDLVAAMDHVFDAVSTRNPELIATQGHRARNVAGACALAALLKQLQELELASRAGDMLRVDEIASRLPELRRASVEALHRELNAVG